MTFRAIQTSTTAAICLLAGLTWAAPQEATPTQEATPAQATPAQATEEEAPAQALPACPPPEGAPAAELPACPPAQPPPVAEAPPPPPPVAEAPPPQRRKHNLVFAPQEIALITGAGPANYFGTSVGSTIDTGAAWNARALFGAHSVFALEAGYVGSVNNIDIQATTGRIQSNGVDGDLRLQLPTRVQPYVFGGVGYNRMTLVIDQPPGPANSPLQPHGRSDDQLTVPAGGGLTGYIGKHATVDLRGTYRYTPDNGITVMSQAALHQWVAQANLGYVF